MRIVSNCLIAIAIIVSTIIVSSILPARAQIPSNGATQAGTIVPNNTTGVNLKAMPGIVMDVIVSSIASAPAYLKLYNKATAPTCGTDTPVKRIAIPAAATAANGTTTPISFPVGIKFSLGIGYCVTTGIGDSDTTAPTASTILLNIDWN